MLALAVIETQQACLVCAANAIVDRAELKDAAQLLMDANIALEWAKVDWLQATQHKVQIAPVIPDKTLLVEH